MCPSVTTYKVSSMEPKYNIWISQLFVISQSEHMQMRFFICACGDDSVGMGNDCMPISTHVSRLINVAFDRDYEYLTFCY